MKTIYEFSKDYERLYDLVKDGNTIACFVDYYTEQTRPENEDNIYRDICKCKVVLNWIEFGVRGICYMSAHEHEGHPEKEQFLNVCDALNVVWIDHP